MAKEISQDAERAARKAEKKALKEAKRSETDGVHKSKKDKKRKDKAIDVDADAIQTTTKILNTLEAEAPGSVVVKDDEQQTIEVNVKPMVGALVPFAHPLVEDKAAKKVLKTVKKANKISALKRGVKEVVKAIRKSPVPPPSSTTTPGYVCVLAADISPMDVISHLPVLCEDHGIPYVFVTSRAELGAASHTKRPTSVTLIGKEVGKRRKVDGDKEDKEEKDDGWGEIYEEVVKLVQKAGQGVRI